MDSQLLFKVNNLVLERFEVNTDGPNLLEGDVTFRRMGKYTK
jgi:hypothetical protein